MIEPIAPVGESLPPRARLRKKRDFQHVFKGGWRVGNERLRLVIRENDLGYSRLGLAVGRRVGNAVVRNRVKRRLREIFRKERQRFPGALDVVVVPQAKVVELSYDQLCEQLVAMVTRWKPREQRK